jgi:hypothetical protein
MSTLFTCSSGGGGGGCSSSGGGSCGGSGGIHACYDNFSFRWICVEYYLLRVQGIAKLLDQLDLIGRTSELARLFGIQFLEVFSRGSQVCKLHIIVTDKCICMSVYVEEIEC